MTKEFGWYVKSLQMFFAGSEAAKNICKLLTYRPNSAIVEDDVNMRVCVLAMPQVMFG